MMWRLLRTSTKLKPFLDTCITRHSIHESILPTVPTSFHAIITAVPRNFHNDNHSPWQFTANLAAASIIMTTIVTTSLSEQKNPQSAPPHETEKWNMLSLDQRRRAFFKYEKRVRELSSPEKTFEYFSSTDADGCYMTPSDMMRSVISVYPPEGSDVLRAGSLPGEPKPILSQEESKFFAAFDIDDSKGISFDEWLLFQALLAVPPGDVEVAFALIDTSGDGNVDMEEFQSLLRAIASRAAVYQHGARYKSKMAFESLSNAHGGLVAIFFGGRGNKSMTLEKFQSFIENMRNELARLEFMHYDYDKKGYISGKDFAHSIVGCGRMKHIDEYLNRVANMPEKLASVKVSLSDFQTFRASWRKLHQLSVALEFWYHSAAGAKITPADFQRVVGRCLGTNIPQHIVDILFYLFESPNGGLNVEYMLSLMGRHLETGLQVNKGGDNVTGEKSFFECLSKCKRK